MFQKIDNSEAGSNFLTPTAQEKTFRLLTERLKRDGIRFDEEQVVKELGCVATEAKIVLYEWYRYLADQGDWLELWYYHQLMDDLEKIQRDPGSFNYLDRRNLRERRTLLEHFREETEIIRTVVYGYGGSWRTWIKEVGKKPR